MTPDGKSVFYSQSQKPSDSPVCAANSRLVEQPIAGGPARVVVGFAFDAMVSPDGQWLAYVMNESCAAGTPSPDFLGLTNLKTGVNYRPYEQELGEHPAKIDVLGWSPGSNRLVYNEFRTFDDGSDQKTLVLDGLPFGKDSADQTPLPVPGLVSAATYLPDGHLLVALAAGNQYDVVELDDAGNPVGKRFHAAGPAPSTMALDPSGTRLLLTLPDGTLLVQDGRDGPRAIDHNTFGAAWLPATP